MTMDRLATEDFMACRPSVESMDQCAATWQRNCGELWRGTAAQELMINKQLRRYANAPWLRRAHGQRATRVCVSRARLLLSCKFVARLLRQRKEITNPRSSFEGRSHHAFG